MRIKYFLLLGIVIGTVVDVVANDRTPPLEFRTLDVPEGHFRCEVLQGWNCFRDRHEEERMHYHGVFLDGPKEDEGIEPTLSVRYFAPDNTFFAGAEGYLQRQFRPSRIKLSGETTSDARDVSVAGRPAKTFTRDTFRFFPPDSLDTKQIPVREEHFVVPHLGGFVVIRFEAPTKVFAVRRTVLQRLLDTLRISPEKQVVTLRIAVPGLDPEDVEKSVAQLLEAQTAGIPNLKGSWSTSLRGQCLIALEFEHTADAATIRQEIQRRTAAVRSGLPAGAVASLEPAVADYGSVMEISLSTADHASSQLALVAQLSALAERAVIGRINAIPGVAQSTIVGPRPRYEVIPSIERLAAQGIDIRELVAAVRTAAKSLDRATVDRGTSPMDLSRLTVASRNGSPITIGDVAEVRLGLSEPENVGERLAGDVRKEVASPSVVISIRNSADTDCGAVYRAVERVLDDIRTTLPPGVKLESRVATKWANPCLKALGIDGEQFIITVAGADFVGLSDEAAKLHDVVRKIPGVVDLRIKPLGSPSLRLVLNREQASRYEFTEADQKEVIDVAEAIIEHRPAAKFAGPHGISIDVTVMPADDDPAVIARLPLQTSDGARLPLGAIADISIVEGPHTVVHRGDRRVVVIAVRIADGDVEAAIAGIKAACMTVQLSLGYSLEIIEAR